MKQVATFFFSIGFFFLYGQNGTVVVKDSLASTGYFLTLNNGKKIVTYNLRYADSYIKQGVLIANNNDQYSLYDVKDYKIKEGYYKKMAFVNQSKDNATWFKQEDAGHIKVYSQFMTYVSKGRIVQHGQYYFQSGDKGLQKFKYHNLINLVKSNPKSLDLMNQGYSKGFLKTVLWVAYAGMFVSGVNLMACSNRDAACGARQGKGLALMMGSLVPSMTAIFIKSPKDKYREAVYWYNKEGN